MLGFAVTLLTPRAGYLAALAVVPVAAFLVAATRADHSVVVIRAESAKSVPHLSMRNPAVGGLTADKIFFKKVSSG